MSSSPVTYATLPASPRFPHTESTLAQRANLVAGDRLRAPSSSSPMLLVGGEDHQADDYTERLTEAYQLLKSEEYEEARGLFAKILQLSKTSDLKSDSLIPAHCHLGIAYSYPDDASSTSPRANAASDALKALDLVCDNANIARWSRLSPQKQSSAFLELRSCLRRVLPLIPKAETDHIQKTKAIIISCGTCILPMDELNEKIREADRCVAKMEPAKARKLYQEALELKTGLEPNFMVVRASCFLKYAGTFSSRNPKRAYLVSEAEGLLSHLYDSRDWLGNSLNTTKEGGYAILGNLFAMLLELTPQESDQRRFIETRIGFFRPALTNQGEQASGTSPIISKRHVTRGSVGGSRKPARLFTGLVLLALTAVAAVTLYRRFVRVS